ncbi:hypothetical protein [uncultured Sphingomonas sp.]|uniref:hypothetical protein n=1 Tax=uncultured Sphingomonas sp. TaxID=158754 RepID=UPI002614CF9B|nr:hypothetical protein [uncultured Sphingomonas sp.]
MATTLKAHFETRRDADMTVERLVQEFGVERTDIFVTTTGGENSAGEETAGSDGEAGQPAPEARDDAALHGPIEVSVDLEDEGKVADVRSAFAEFGAADLAEG